MRAEVYGCPAGNNVFPVLIYKFHWKFPLLKEHSTLLNPLRSGSANCASKISPWICHAGILGTPSYTLLDSKFQTTFFCFIFPGRCTLPLGLEDKRIVDGAFSASTYYNHHLAPWLGRINSIRSWSARVKNARQWLQISLGNIARVTGIATQGRRDATQFVTRYVLSYGDGTTFKAYREKGRIRVSHFNRSSSKPCLPT